MPHWIDWPLWISQPWPTSFDHSDCWIATKGNDRNDRLSVFSRKRKLPTPFVIHKELSCVISLVDGKSNSITFSEMGTSLNIRHSMLYTRIEGDRFMRHWVIRSRHRCNSCVTSTRISLCFTIHSSPSFHNHSYHHRDGEMIHSEGKGMLSRNDRSFTKHDVTPSSLYVGRCFVIMRKNNLIRRFLLFIPFYLLETMQYNCSHLHRDQIWTSISSRDLPFLRSLFHQIRNALRISFSKVVGIAKNIEKDRNVTARDTNLQFTQAKLPSSFTSRKLNTM